MPTEDKTKLRANAKRWRQRHPEAVREQKRRYYHRSKERLRDQRNERNLQASQQKRQEVLQFLGGKCQRCDFNDWRALQIDHINGGGGQERRRLLNKDSFLNAVKADTTGKYQLLCANCNWIKRCERNEYRWTTAILEEEINPQLEIF